MARTSSFQNPQRTIISTLEDQHKYDLPTLRRLDIAARPVDAYAAPAMGIADTSAGQLSSALGDTSTKLLGFLEEYRKQRYEEDQLVGQAEATKDGLKGTDAEKKAEEHSRGFIHGYMKLKGQLAMQEDANGLQEAWIAAPKVDAKGLPITFDEFSQEYLKKKANGLNQPSFMAGYVPGMAETIYKMRQKEAEESAKKLSAQVDADAHTWLSGAIKNVPNFDMKTWESMRGDIEFAFGKKDANEVLFNVMKEAAGRGDAALVEKIAPLLEQKHSDGTPGLQQYLPHKEELVYQAYHKQQTYSKAAKDAKKKQLEDKFDDVFSPLFAKMLAGEVEVDAVMANVAQHFKDNPEMGIKSMAEMQGVILRAGTREESRDQKMNLLEMHSKLLDKGGMKREEVADAVKNKLITPQQGSFLLTEANRLKREAKMEANQNNAILKQERQYVISSVKEGVVNSLPKDELFADSPYTVQADWKEYRATSLRDMSLEMLKATDSKQMNEIADRWSKRLREKADSIIVPPEVRFKNFKPQFDNPQAAFKAFSEGKLTTAAFEKSMSWFEWQKTKKEKTTK